MHRHSRLRAYICGVLVTILVAVLSGCSPQNQPLVKPESSVSKQPRPLNQASALTTPTTTPGPIVSNGAPALNPSGIMLNAQGLHIQSYNGFQCPSGVVASGPANNPGPPGVLGEPSNLVLATDNLNQVYDPDQIQQIITYVQHHQFESYLTNLPSTLRWVSGGALDNNPLRRSEGGYGLTLNDCGELLQITNNLNIPIQIPSVGVELVQAPQQNTFQYHLIDTCTLGECHKSGGGPGLCSVYFATIYLSEAATSPVKAIPTGGDASCLELTIQPHGFADLVINVYSSSNLIYSVMPEITLDTGNGGTKLLLSSSPNILAFAHNNQFTCYGFDQSTNTFVLEDPVPKGAVCL